MPPKKLISDFFAPVAKKTKESDVPKTAEETQLVQLDPPDESKLPPTATTTTTTTSTTSTTTTESNSNPTTTTTAPATTTTTTTAPATTTTTETPKQRFDRRPTFAFENLEDGLPDDWKQALKDEFNKPYWKSLKSKLCAARDSKQQIFPQVKDIFAAFWLCPLDTVRVFICGQDPYHDDGQAMGLAFSVPKGIKKFPPSLLNIAKEIATDIENKDSTSYKPPHGDLLPWAEQGVFLLNTVLTVKAHEANSHKDMGWLTFTTAVVNILAKKSDLVWILWGAPAQKLGKVANRSKNCIIESVHPSPLSAHKGFFGTKPFSRANTYLKSKGFQPINWKLGQ